jgi:hypothetical protein
MLSSGIGRCFIGSNRFVIGFWAWPIGGMLLHLASYSKLDEKPHETPFLCGYCCSHLLSRVSRSLLYLVGTSVHGRASILGRGMLH